VNPVTTKARAQTAGMDPGISTNSAPRLIATDFDGTIFAEFENPPVPEAFQAAVAALQARGAQWVINTGRDLSSLMEALGRAGVRVQPDFLVLVERELYAHDGVQYVPVEDWNQRCAADHAELFARVQPDVPRLTAWVNERFNAAVYADAWSPFCLIAYRPADADAICRHLEAYCRQVPGLTVVRNDVYARFSHEAYSKGTALAELTRRRGLTATQVFAAGDHLNDLPMLRREVARWLVCPANAIPEVREQVRRQGGEVSPLPHGHALADTLSRWLD
jgi:hypothetical protein